MTLFFDVETTGLPPKHARYDQNFDQFPHIVQIAWHYKDTWNDFIIQPNNYSIPDNVAAIHGITTEIANKDGQPFENVIKKFIIDCNEAKTLVGHNIFFDTSVIKANIIRYFGITDNFFAYAEDALDKHKRIDTMTKTIKFCGLGKFPTLSELHLRLFNEYFPAHNALEDIKALKRCYEGLKEINIL